MIKSFEEIKSRLKDRTEKRKVAVACAQDEHTIEAVMDAYTNQILIPVLLGEREKIIKLLQGLNKSAEGMEIMDIGDPAECAQKAAELVNSGMVQGIMKGKIKTGAMMKVLLSKESNLRLGKPMSLLAFMEVPTYHKIFAITDVGLNTYPDLDQKRAILENAVDTFRRLGIDCPKVAVMAAVEHVNQKMQETVEADMLKQMNRNGELPHCIVEGPISYDLAVSEEAARIKDYDSPVAGDADIMLVPDIVAGNLLAKSLLYSGNARTAGIIVGAKAPIVITSRSATADDKYMSLALAALIGK
ncbi:bifunctional enoyl-CoA hydratase/phosphate acetyltransferase [Lutispora saccharofermentans]|uniref:Bifunctional enoyl-CoA hydratase/phosphate acetyltransferase n=1 Tax=Lutispora saccharofermentans TaxID=3024236 RepID=A0ABT1NIS3_9FIRM|nr:bifunctional enoyl-CoA hydratase/phosphate acetyltransferase [Lutispora saccharofermentans]MCQ1531170.1 bifunctional enoyl-CoA hydratase/phosphate acetyltransferase [Lutispora saccharofermentans]